MRKLMIALAFAGLTTAAMAQETEIPVLKNKVVTNSFWANWFISVGGDYHAAYTSQEVSGLDGNPFSHKRGTFGFNVAVGKWFTPGIGLRTKFDGIWSKNVNDENYYKTYQYWNIHEDVMFNLSNMLFGYNEKRVWNFIPYVGLGFARNMTRNQNYDFTYNFGLLNNFRITNHWAIFVDVYAAAIEGSLCRDNAKYGFADSPAPATEYRKNGVAAEDWENHRKGWSRHWDKMVGVAVGVTYNLGKCTWDKVPDVDALMAMNKEQMDALNAALKEQQDENARLRDLLANQKPAEPVVKTVKEVVSTATSVFFNLNSSKIASRKDLVNVKEVAEYAKANNSTLVVTGYADSKTGTPAINQALSEKRAKAVAEELVKMGVNRENIEVQWEGGVNIISPYSYNRRTTVKVK